MTTLNLSGSIARPRTTAKKGYYQEKQDPFPERWEGEAGCLEIAFNSTAESLDPLSCLLGRKVLRQDLAELANHPNICINKEQNEDKHIELICTICTVLSISLYTEYT